MSKKRVVIRDAAAAVDVLRHLATSVEVGRPQIRLDEVIVSAKGFYTLADRLCEAIGEVPDEDEIVGLFDAPPELFSELSGAAE